MLTHSVVYAAACRHDMDLFLSMQVGCGANDADDDDVSALDDVATQRLQPENSDRRRLSRRGTRICPGRRQRSTTGEVTGLYWS